MMIVNVITGANRDEMEYVKPSLSDDQFAVWHAIGPSEYNATTCIALDFDTRAQNMYLFEKTGGKVNFSNYNHVTEIVTEGNVNTGSTMLDFLIYFPLDDSR